MKLFKMPSTVNDISIIGGVAYVISNGLYQFYMSATVPRFTMLASQRCRSIFNANGTTVVNVSNEDKTENIYFSLNGELVELNKDQEVRRIAQCQYVYNSDDWTETLISDLVNNRIVIEEGNTIDESDSLIFSRSDMFEKAQCFNNKLELVWEQCFEHDNDEGYIGSCRQAFFTSKAYIFYQGLKDDQKQIIALDKLTGETLWQHTTSEVITSVSQYQEVTCITVAGKLLQLDSSNGEIIAEVDSGLAPKKFQAFVRDDDYLYFTCYLDHQVRIFNANSLELLHVVNIPDPFSTSRLALPVCFDDGLLIRMRARDSTHATTTFGVLHISKDEIAKGEPIKLDGEIEPQSAIECIRGDDGFDYYQVTLEDANIDLVERFMEVKVLELAAAYANQPFPAETVNKHFGGTIKIKIDKAVLESKTTEIDENKFHEAIKRLNKNLASFSPGATNGVSDLDISWQWL